MRIPDHGPSRWLGLATPSPRTHPSLDYRPRPRSIPGGPAPGLIATELSPRTRTFHIIFTKDDDVAAGLADFAEKNHLTNAHFSAIGAFGSAVIGWSDRPKKAFKVVKLNEEMEVAAFNGSIIPRQGRQAPSARPLRRGASKQRPCLCRPLPRGARQPDYAAVSD